jgi:carbamoyltransferase
VGVRPDPTFEHLYYGPAYDDEQIETTLRNAKVPYERVEDICVQTAELLADGHLVGWFQGRMEFGARALGNRSILADPRSVSARDAVNANVKDREEWRPFAPSLRHERREKYLESAESMPFMIRLDTVQTDRREDVAAIVHTDGTTRPQTVPRNTNERFHRLLRAFEARTGIPVLLNTSFNVSGEPIVESPEQALRDFYATGLDALAIGDFLLTKPGS